MNQRLTINVYFCYAAPPAETPSSSSLPTLPLMKSVYPVPPPPPQVFIIKENSASSKDPEDRKSAEALDNLSKTFEDAFTEAYTSERKTDRLQDTPRRERFRQRLHQQDVSDSDSDEPRWGRFRQREHEQEKFDSDSHEHHRERFRQREREQDRSDSNVDSDDEVVANSEDEEDEERLRSSVGSRRDFRDHNATEDTETSEGNEINNKSDDDDDNDDDDNDNNNSNDNNDDDDDDDNNNDDGRDDDNDDNSENKDSDSALDTEPSSDADEPRHSHSQQYHSRWHRTRLRVEKGKKLGFEDHDKGSQHGRFHLSHEMRNRFAKHQRVRQHSHKKKYQALKNKKRKELSRKQVFDPSGTENFQRKLPKAILRPGEHRKGKTKTAKKVNVKHRLGTHYKAKEKSQLPTSHDRSNFAHLQGSDSGKYHHQDSGQRHIHHHKKHSQPKSLPRGHQDGNQHGHRYNHEKHIHQGSHFNTEIDLSGEDISESGSSFEGSASLTDEASTSMKYDETVSSSNYGRVNHDIPAKNGDVKKHVKTLSHYAQSLKPRARHVSLKQKEVKSYQNDREDSYYSSGEESGDTDFSETEGSNFEYFIQNWLY